MTHRQRKTLIAITVLYSLFILYFLFIGLGRMSSSKNMTGYSFMFIPSDFFKLPSLSDFLHPTLMDFVSLGNIAAFIPFGILIPLLYRTRFVRFIALFFLAILAVEMIQALTKLGSFDINDAIQNSTGAAIGYGAYFIGFRVRDSRRGWRDFAITGASAVLLWAGVWGAFGLVDVVASIKGPLTALSELKDRAGNTSRGTTELDPFVAGGQTVTPKHNVYGSGESRTETYTYSLGRKSVVLSGTYGVPDRAEFTGSIVITVDGDEILSDSTEYQGRLPNRFEFQLESANELTMTLTGNEKLWDFGFR
ncbi:VanZ family protein [Gorillibacterium sp. CAU 1737]|uniref:VanZ family protein n=1 Tax=Gorillibacterium sp. CAU 1737 TaxID=3140362 RepID=UPI0032607575